MVDGFEAGYVWDTRSAASTSTPSTPRPLKDGYYDHGQNCLEYAVLAFGPASGVKSPAPPADYSETYLGPHAWMA
jgi:hypothetical protein